MEALPKEVLWKIVNYISFEDYLNCLRGLERCRKKLNHKMIWQYICNQHLPILSEVEGSWESFSWSYINLRKGIFYPSKEQLDFGDVSFTDKEGESSVTKELTSNLKVVYTRTVRTEGYPIQCSTTLYSHEKGEWVEEWVYDPGPKKPLLKIEISFLVGFVGGRRTACFGSAKYATLQARLPENPNEKPCFTAINGKLVESAGSPKKWKQKCLLQ